MIIGIDEVGRGAWAGPLVVGAVGLSAPINGLADSKKLTKKRREELDQIIRQRADFINLGWVTSKEVDSLGLAAALKLACERAIVGCPEAQIIIDGNINFLQSNPLATNLIKADDSVPAVSAASIVAKVARDHYMVEQSSVYPNFGFEAHVGYGTEFHRKSLKKLGITPLHRMSYKPVQRLFA